MNYEIIATPQFKRDIKKLVKKYVSLKYEYAKLIEILEKNPIQGTSLGENCFKIRIAIASKQKGKSGGARVITYVILKEKTIFLLTIYDKSEKESVSVKELQALLNQIDK